MKVYKHYQQGFLTNEYLKNVFKKVRRYQNERNNN